MINGVSTHFQGIILSLERCIEIMWEKLMLFTLYNVLANLFLKPGHVHWFQDVDTECIQRVLWKVWELLV